MRAILTLIGGGTLAGSSIRQTDCHLPAWNMTIGSKGVVLPDAVDPLRRPNEKSSERSGAGMIIQIAVLRILRRARVCAHVMKTPISSSHSPKPLTKHCSALLRSAVRRNDNRYRLCISSVKIFQQSVPVEYVGAVSSKICPGSSIFNLLLSTCAGQGDGYRFRDIAHNWYWGGPAE